MTDRRSDNAGKGNSHKHKTAAEGLSVSQTAPRRPRIETEAAPLRLRYWGSRLAEVSPHHEHELSQVVIELPLSEVRRFLPQRLMVELYQLFRKFVEGTEGPSFPCPLAALRQDRGLLAALRSQLTRIDDLIELITDPTMILIDEGQRLFFYRGVQVLLRPASFNFLLLLARTPGIWVLREVIYRHLWPGEMNYEGTNMPYERQITDQKRKLLDDIRKGITGKTSCREGEIVSLVATRHKMGYMLNLGREDVLIFHKEVLPAIISFCLLVLDRCTPLCQGWLLNFPELRFVW